MGDCDLCEGDDGFSFTCNFCGGRFCGQHRLPEKHACTGETTFVDRIRERTAYGADKITSGQASATKPSRELSKGDVLTSSNEARGDSGSRQRGTSGTPLRYLALGAMWLVARFLARCFGILGRFAKRLLLLVTSPKVFILALMGVAAVSATVGTGIVAVDQAVDDGIEFGTAVLNNTAGTPTEAEAGSGGVIQGPEGATSDSPTERAGSAGDISRSRVEAEIHSEVNRVRQERGLSTLATDSRLREIARYHSEDMALKGYFAHDSPDGETMGDRYEKFNYDCRVPTGDNRYASGAENIAYTYAFARVSKPGGAESHDGDEQEIGAGIVEQWMNSPGHRENILRPYWRNEGIGVAVTEVDGRVRVYATQNFC